MLFALLVIAQTVNLIHVFVLQVLRRLVMTQQHVVRVLDLRLTLLQLLRARMRNKTEIGIRYKTINVNNTLTVLLALRHSFGY